MRHSSKRFLAFLAVSLLVTYRRSARKRPKPTPAQQALDFPTVLYGAAYYNEYMPGHTHAQADRLDKDVALMKAAGLNVVRMGESTWSLWEPEDGRFEYAWMDRVVDAMGKAGIKVILGTPTYSIPAWMAHQHPEILADRMPGGMFGGQPSRAPTACARTWTPIRRPTASMPSGSSATSWPTTKTTPPSSAGSSTTKPRSYDAANPDVFIGFQHYLEKKFGTPEALSKAWFLNYWGENLHTWEDLPTRDGTIPPATSWSGRAGARCASPTFCTGRPRWCASAPAPSQFVTTDYGGMMQRDVNEEAVAAALDIAADNIYHGTQDHFDGSHAVHPGRLHPLAQARAISWSPRPTPRPSAGAPACQFPPYDGQMREDVYTHLANGANMVEYWHWASIAANQETYWKGVLSHDLEPNRAYAEVSRTAHELAEDRPAPGRPARFTTRLPSSGAATRPTPSASCPSRRRGPAVELAPAKRDDYASLVQQMHHSLYDLNVGSDFVFPDDHGFLGLQAADRARALHRRRCAAAAHFRLREERRPRGDDLQERICQ